MTAAEVGGDTVFVGIDVGTQGVRVVAVDTGGEVLAAHRHDFPPFPDTREQSPEQWWSALLPLLRGLAADLAARAPSTRPVALSVTSTSGTVIPLAADHDPLHTALMYSDDRTAAEAAACRRASETEGSAAVPFGTSYGLPKLLWYARTHPRQAERIAVWCHAADFVLGRLSGVWGVTDPTNALKTGYDPAGERWPAYITGRLGLPAAWLPRVVPSGSVLGPLRPEVAAETGLPASLLVTAGMTDGCASQVAAGAVAPGEWSTTIGTTLVVKGVTHRLIVDPLGRVYSHRHPQGYWMPGGASNTGADWIARDYSGQDLDRLDAVARSLIPTPWIAYPLQREGERFPFVSATARGFEPPGLDAEARYAARLEGVAYLERLGYDMLEDLSGESVERVSTAGGGGRSETWLAIRANVLRKPVVRMRHADGAVGAAILAASGTVFAGIDAAARAMTRPERVLEPGPLADAYDDGYRRFVAELEARGYLAEPVVGATR